MVFKNTSTIHRKDDKNTSASINNSTAKYMRVNTNTESLTRFLFTQNIYIAHYIKEQAGQVMSMNHFYEFYSLNAGLIFKRVINRLP